MAAKIWSIVALIHPAAVIIFSLVAWSSAALALRQMPSVAVSTSLILAMACAAATIGMVNEVFDRDIDSIAKPWRAIPSGHISVRWVVVLTLIAFALGVTLAARLAPASVVLLVACVGAGVAYSAKLKRTVFSWLPYLIGYPLVPVWAWASVGKFEPRAIIIFPLAAPFVVAIHLCNQLRDFDDDARLGVRSAVHFLGKGNASALCYALLASGPLPFLAQALFSGRLPCSTILLLVSVVYWSLIASSFSAYRADSNPGVYASLFGRIELTAPLVLVGWLWTQMACA